MKKTVCIVNYNTTELTRAAIRSISKHGGDGYEFIVFDEGGDTSGVLRQITKSY